MSDKLDLIYDTVIDLRAECREEFKQIKEDQKKHAEEMHAHKEETQERLEQLEQPSKTLAQIKKWALWCASIAAGVAAIIKLGEWI